RASQIATVRQVSENRYSGSFYNSEYSISGVIDIVVRGASQTVRLLSESGSAVINLSREKNGEGPKAGLSCALAPPSLSGNKTREKGGAIRPHTNISSSPPRGPMKRPPP